MKEPRIAIGALLGGLLGAPFVAIAFLARQVAGLPFVPFDLFDWLARVLPGPLITFGIDTMVSLIRGLGLGPTSVVAKLAEQTMAIGIFLVASILVGAAFFLLMRRLPYSGLVAGLILGAGVGVFLALISNAVNETASAGPLASTLWILVLSVACGGSLGSAFDHLEGVDTRTTGLPDEVRAAAASAGETSVEAIDRRRFLVRMGGATAAITVVGAGLGAVIGGRGGGRPPAGDQRRWSANNALPNAGASPEPVRGTRPEFTPLEDHYRIDINTRSPVLDESDWRLAIGGMVENPRELNLAQLRDDYEPLHQFVTLACISNPIAGDLISTTRWTGVPLQHLLQEAAPQPAATHLRIEAADGFYEILDLDLARSDERVMLTYAWDGVPLPTRHGFPLRIYIPNRYGMKQPKWIESLEAIDAWEAGYWVSRGWDRDALMKATSVIDTVAVDMMIVEGDAENMIVPIGGIAHAGDRGISRVELRVDDGPWQVARIRAPLARTTWVVWRYDWRFQEGRHTFTVRCVDGDGRAQIAEESPVRPDGATGLHSMRRML